MIFGADGATFALADSIGAAAAAAGTEGAVGAAAALLVGIGSAAAAVTVPVAVVATAGDADSCGLEWSPVPRCKPLPPPVALATTGLL